MMTWLEIAVLFIFWIPALILLAVMGIHSFNIYKNSGQCILDMQFNYSPKEAYKTLEDMGASGREIYARLNTIDFAFIFFFYPALAFIIRLVEAEGNPGYLFLLLLLPPFCAMIADGIENIYVRKMLNKYPEKVPLVARRANYATMTKNALILITVAEIFMLIVQRILNI